MFYDLYLFITNPTQFLEDHREDPPKNMMFFVLYLTCLGFSAGTSHPILMSLLWFLGCTVILVFYSAILDFIAQLFSYKAQSKVLFSYLGLAYLPYCLSVPINLLVDVHAYSVVLTFIPICLSFFLELTIIKSVYRASYSKSFLIWIMPTVSIVGTVILGGLLWVGVMG